MKLRFIPITLVLGFLIIHTNSYSQLGGLKKKLGKKADSKSVNIDWSKQKYMPAISLSSILSNDGLKLELDGTFKISTLEISFLPKKDAKGEIIKYDPYKRSDFVLTADLKNTATSEQVHTFYFTVNPVSRPFSLMTCILRPRDDMHDSVSLEEGTYQLIFKVGKKEVHAYQFEVEKKTNDDAYAAMNEMYFLNGDWRKYGRLSFNEYVEERPLFFEFYILNNTTDVENEHRPNKQKEIKFSFQLFRNGQVVAASDVNSDGDIPESIAHGRRGYWNITGSQLLKYPAKRDRRGAISEFFTQEDLADGNYTIKLSREKFDGSKAMEEFEFAVTNGSIRPLPQADRAKHDDWQSLIEQGPKYHFIKRKK